MYSFATIKPHRLLCMCIHFRFEFTIPQLVHCNIEQHNYLSFFVFGFMFNLLKPEF